MDIRHDLDRCPSAAFHSANVGKGRCSIAIEDKKRQLPSLYLRPQRFRITGSPHGQSLMCRMSKRQLPGLDLAAFRIAGELRPFPVSSRYSYHSRSVVCERSLCFVRYTSWFSLLKEQEMLQHIDAIQAGSLELTSRPIDRCRLRLRFWSVHSSFQLLACVKFPPITPTTHYDLQSTTYLA